MSRIRVDQYPPVAPASIAPVSTLPMFLPPITTNHGSGNESQRACISASWLPTVYPVELIQICKGK